MKALAASLAACALVMVSCRGSGDGQVRVVASFWPLGEAAEQIGLDRVDVRNLTPPGVEPHGLELTDDRADAIRRADVVLVLGHGFQPAIEKAAARREGPTVSVLDALGASAGDPHVWLDPQNMVAIVRLVNRALDDASPRGAADFDADADLYAQKLATLAREYGLALRECPRRTIVTAHAAWGYLAAAFGLRQEGVAGLDPSEEPDATRTAALVELLRSDDIDTVFSEPLVSTDLLRSIAGQARGVRLVPLDPLEGLTADQLDDGADYLSVMRANLAALQAALRCT